MMLCLRLGPTPPAQVPLCLRCWVFAACASWGMASAVVQSRQEPGGILLLRQPWLVPAVSPGSSAAIGDLPALPMSEQVPSASLETRPPFTPLLPTSTGCLAQPLSSLSPGPWGSLLAPAPCLSMLSPPCRPGSAPSLRDTCVDILTLTAVVWGAGDTQLWC